MILAVNQFVGDAETGQDVGDDLEAGAEQGPGGDDVVARLELAGQ